MKCLKCGKENSVDSQFCSQCGISLEEKEMTNNKIKKVEKNKSKLTLIIGGILIVVLLLFFTLKDINDPLKKFSNQVGKNDTSGAIQVYSDKIKGDKQKEKDAEEIILEELQEIKELYTDEKVEYDKAIEKIDDMKKIGIQKSAFTTVISYINKLEDSRIAYETAEEYLNENHLSKALDNYKKVIKDDKNYKVAQSKITENKEKYLAEVFSEVEMAADNDDFKDAVKQIKDALTVVPKDEELVAKQTIYEAKLKEQEIEINKKKAEEAKNNQLAIVTQTKIISQTNDVGHKWIYPDMLSTYVKNLSDKTIRNFEVGILAYDSNGLPIKIKLNTYNPEGAYEFTGIADDANIVPDGVFGEGVGWELHETHGISKIIANVKNVTYFDGSTWYNDYYDIWLAENKEQPLNKK